MLTAALSSCGLFWKLQYLQKLCAGNSADATPFVIVETQEGPKDLTFVQELVALGAQNPHLGASNTGPDHRFALATKSV